MDLSFNSFLDHYRRSKRYRQSTGIAHQNEKITVGGILYFDSTFLARTQAAILKHSRKYSLFLLCFLSLIILASGQLSKIIYPTDILSRFTFFFSTAFPCLLVLFGYEILTSSIPTSCMNVDQRNAFVARVFSNSCRAEGIDAYKELTEIIQFRKNFDKPQYLLALGSLALNFLRDNEVIKAILSGNLTAIWSQSYLDSIILSTACILGVLWFFLIRHPLFWMHRTRNQISRSDIPLQGNRAPDLV
jgi:hypothetical protein